MKIPSGEFELIEALIRGAAGEQNTRSVVPNGDDGAVLRIGEQLVAVSVDGYLEERHFSFEYFEPEDVGIKVIEASASDLVAMGAKPSSVLISVAIPPSEEARERLTRIYQGVGDSIGRLGAELLGGDCVSSSCEQTWLNVTVLGLIEKEQLLCRRSGAQPGDVIFVSGPTGLAAAGLELLQAQADDYKRLQGSQLRPRCRDDLLPGVHRYATSMIDISDGLSSELHHICRMSGVGARIFRESVALDEDLISFADSRKQDPYQYALHGGEDYELLFTTSPEDAEQIEGMRIGEITSDLEILLSSSGRELPLLPGGFNHFE